MTNELAIAAPPSPTEMQVYMQQADILANSALVPAKFRGKPSDVLVAALQGRELGLGVTTAMNYIDIIQGVPTINARGKMALIRRHGHSIQGEADAQRAVVKGTRADNGDTLTVEYTFDEARQAGLAGKDNWKKHTADMLWARAVSRLSRRLFEDVFAGCSYDPSEIDEDREPAPTAQVVTGAAVDVETGEIVDVVEPTRADKILAETFPIEAQPDRYLGPSGDDPSEEDHKRRMAALHASLHEAFAIPPGHGRSDKEATAKDELLQSYGCESASELTIPQIESLINVCKKDPARVRKAAGLPEPVEAA